MKALTKLVPMLILTALTSGCFEGYYRLRVKKDGSGSIVVKTILGPMAVAQMTAMTGAMAVGIEEMTGKAVTKEEQMELDTEMFVQKDKLAAKAKDYGEGVTLKSAKLISKKDGSKGSMAIYTFDDVTKLRLSASFDDEDEDDPKEQDSMKIVYTFKFKKGPQPTLTIVPNIIEPEKKPTARALKAKAQQMMAMMPMMKGAQLSIVVQIQGRIVDTNAKHVWKKRNAVTLQYINLDKMMTNKAVFKKMLMLENDPVAQSKLKLKGFMLEDPKKTITVQFE